MTELLSPDQLRRVARVLERPEPAVLRPSLRMAWTIDATNGRPVARWVVVDERSDRSA
jgi:hypothetical protein